MATWRRKAIESFPELRGYLSEPDSNPYGLFPQLVELAWRAHESGDGDTARSVYAYADWCFHQRAYDLSNAAGVSFYEHLFTARPHEPENWSWPIANLSTEIIRSVWGLWELFHTEEELRLIARLCREQGKGTFSAKHGRQK